MRWRKFRARRVLGIAGAVVAVTAGFARPVRELAAIPETVMVPQGEKIAVPWSSWLSLKKMPAEPVTFSAQSVWLQARAPGTFVLHTELFGWLPWRQVPVEVTHPVYAVAGGESIGVLVNTRGLVVKGFRPLRFHGRWADPAEQAGIDRGDVILQAGHRAVDSESALENAVQQAGAHHHAVDLGVEGQRSFHLRAVRPLWSPDRREWQIGLTVQAGASGVGTLSFYNPRTLKFAALGHSITDGLTRAPVAVRSGKVTGANIVGIIPGRGNVPGQKIGVLTGGQDVQGSVSHNGIFGITGQLAHAPEGSGRLLPVALPDQVHPGLAQIVTVLQNQRTQKYAVRILRTFPQGTPHTKGLLFEVVDPTLLAKAGGVVQGMSGSPIIQGGRLVGTVTHVLISRPSMGYGCYAYWMVKQKSFA